MRLGTRFLFLTTAAALLAAATGLVVIPERRAYAGDKVAEAAALAKKRDEFRKKRKEEQKLPFLDLSYAADLKVCKETRWTQTDPPHPEATEESGMQFRAGWSPDITKGGGISVTAYKWIHKSPDGKSVYTYEFKLLGTKCNTSESDKMMENFYAEDLKKLNPDDNQKTKCKKPAKKKVGPPTEMWASAWGTDPESKKRTRRDTYMWVDGGATWMIFAEFDEKYLDDPEIMDKAEDFIASIKPLKPPK